MRLNGWKAVAVVTTIVLSVGGLIFTSGGWVGSSNVETEHLKERQAEHEYRLDCLEEKYYTIQAQAAEDYGKIREDMGQTDERLGRIEQDMGWMRTYLENGGSP
jgi:hypothetical protein